jgi:1-acyl-sn-glycerol-3-phosphate acyltransferase
VTRRLPAPLLYEVVGLGMAGYASLVHRAVLLEGERLRLEPGVVLTSTHLSDADVPVLAGAIYRGARMWRDPRIARPSFAVRNDLLLPGYLAGYPRGLPRALRRALWPIGIGPVMTRWVRCLPVRFGDRMRLVEALRRRPDLDLAVALPPARFDALRRRAAERGRPAPRLGREVLAGDYADIVWEDVKRAELDDPGLEDLWEEQLAVSALELRGLIRHVRHGGALVFFPHGELSSDGAIGLLDGRPARLLRSARPVAVQPVAIAHDPLTRGRPRAFVGVGEPLERPTRRGGEEALLRALRRALPLACGQVVAHAVLTLGVDTAAAAGAVERALDRARRDARPIEPDLEIDATRRARVEEAAAAIRRLGGDHPAVKRAARTYESALEPAR